MTGRYGHLRNWRWWVMLPLMLITGLVAVWGPILDSISRGVGALADQINHSKTMKSIMDWVDGFTEWRS